MTLAPLTARHARLMATALTVAVLSSSAVPALAQDADEPLTVYSGRSEDLVGPILEDFTEASGIPVEVRYGDTAELAALLLEEGERSPADVFFAQDAGALGAVAEAELLASLDPTILERVPAGFSDPDGEWVGISGRVRTAAYTAAEEISLPDSILDFADPAWSGRIGWAPTNGSFQAFVTALRVAEGEDVAREWLEGIIANEPVEYASNTAAVEGVAAGEVDVAFVNHYYLLRLIAEQGADFPVAQRFFELGDPGSLVNVAGVGILATTDQTEAASELVDLLLSEEAQQYFSDSTYEYPLIEGVAADPRLPALDSVGVPGLDLSQLADLQGTVELLREVGALE